MKKIFLLLMLAAFAVSSCCNCTDCNKKALLDMEKMNAADSVINQTIAEGLMPGAVLAVVVDGQTAYMKAYGNKSVFPDTIPMTVETVFDMASCSKHVRNARQGHLPLCKVPAQILPAPISLQESRQKPRQGAGTVPPC